MTARLRQLQHLFPGDACLDGASPEALVYCTDSSRLTDPTGKPLAVVRPENREQVVELMRWAQAERVAVVPRARATNRVGDVVPPPGSVVVSLLHMNRILEISVEDFVAVVEPCVITAELQQAVAEQGLFYPPDPASVKYCTVGGNISTGAGGMRALKYGATRDYVLGVEAVLPGGEILHAGSRCHKNVVGLDLARIFVASEGTLGIVTRATVKLLPRPQASATLFAAFASAQAALEAARAVFGAGLLPAAMEFLSSLTLEAVRRNEAQAGRDVPWPQSAGAALLLRLDGTEAAVGEDLPRLEALLPGALLRIPARTPAEEEPLWELRRSISQANHQLGPDKLSDDVTVPRGKAIELVGRIETMAAERGLRIAVFGHLGDGNLHVNIMHDASNQAMREAALRTKKDVLHLAVDLGGTLSGEHGVGLSKLPYLGWQLSETEIRLMRGVKAVFDPHGIMNPGKAY